MRKGAVEVFDEYLVAPGVDDSERSCYQTTRGHWAEVCCSCRGEIDEVVDSGR